MYSASGASGELHAHVIRNGMIHRPDIAAGAYEHQGIVGDLSRFSNDAADWAKENWVTALHALHLTAEGTKLHAELISRGASHAEAANAVIKANDDAAALGEPNGFVKGSYHLGPGATTNVGALSMANDPFWAAPSGASIATLKACNFHAMGTGTTAAAASDIALQTSAGPTPVAGTQTLVSAANAQKLQTVATLAFVSTLAITEWGLHNSATLSATTGTPFTATSATSATATGTPYTASTATVQGQQQTVIKAGTTTVWGLVVSNTTSVLTIPAWYTVAAGLAGSTPGATEAFSLLALMFDHKVFASINVVSGDSIQTTYGLTINSNG